jgi:superfamily II RNA helicase
MLVRLPRRMTSFLRLIDPTKPCETCPPTQFTFPLDPFQQHAISAISKDENVLVTAKTGSGKTLVGEYQIYHSLAKGKKVFYTTPIKSLSNQKFHDLKKMWPGRVGIMTGDIKFQPTADIVVMTTEILRNLLFKYNSTTRELGITASLSLDDLDAVIFDEVHYINNRERGRVWEETLILLPPRVNLVLLSATIEGPELFANWLGNLKQKPIHLISTLYRIVPLTHAVVAGPERFITIMNSTDHFEASLYNAWLKGLKQAEDAQKDHKVAVRNRRAGGYEDPVVHGGKIMSFTHRMNELIQSLHEKELLPALFFSFSRRGCENMASKVQATLLTPSESASVKKIMEFHLHKYKAVFETTNQYFALASLLERGIAYHHSGVLPLLKEMIEILFSKGLVKVLFATETFAVGINMPTKTVVFTGFQKYDEEVNGLRVLHSDEYIQMAGRAGRRGKDKEGLVLYLPERDPIGLDEMKTMLSGNKATFVSRMNFHYDFILKTLQSQNTTWISLMDQSYWKQGQMRLISGARKEITALENDLDVDPSVMQALEEKEELETLVKTKTNKAKKDAQRKLTAWNDEHKGTLWAIHAQKLNKWKEQQKQMQELHAYIAQLEKNEVTVLPLFNALRDLGYLSDFTDPKEITINSLTDLGVLATEINEGHPLLMSRAFHTNACADLTGEEIVCFLAAFMGEREEAAQPLSALSIPATVKTTLYTLESSVNSFLEVEDKYRIMSPVGYWNLNSTWLEPVWRWIQGESSTAICSDYGFYEGNFIRAMLKCGNLLEEWTNLAIYTKNVEMLAKLDGLQTRIVRDIVIPESLYLKL